MFERKKTSEFFQRKVFLHFSKEATLGFQKWVRAAIDCKDRIQIVREPSRAGLEDEDNPKPIGTIKMYNSS